ncbi:MAG: nitrogen regulation protein NR(II) [Gammaproteobacteria bacterium]|nr:nitrogen regulation protein NR(II) [Gammaproteobacteria bacterium]
MTVDKIHKKLLDHLKTGVLLLDEALCVRFMNLAAEQLFEISGRKALGSSLDQLLIGADEDLAEVSAALANSTSFTKREARLMLSHGKRIEIDYTVNVFEDNQGKQLLLELSSLEHAYRINREESLNSVHSTTRELVRGLAHEIKNPLGGIRGAAQLLAAELPERELGDYTNVIIEEADRLRNLVDRLVGLRKAPELAPTNIHEVLERVHSLVEAEIAGGSIRLERDYDPSIPPLPADAEQLIQATLNIVRNAVQALASPSVEHTLGKIILRTRITRNATLSTKFHRLAANIRIIDNGPGIPKDIIDTLFYPMISGRAEGTGLGLSIARDIINRHHGLIECTSRPGATCFSIVLPLA